jgi:hypothetical protein
MLELGAIAETLREATLLEYLLLGALVGVLDVLILLAELTALEDVPIVDEKLIGMIV